MPKLPLPSSLVRVWTRARRDVAITAQSIDVFMRFLSHVMRSASLVFQSTKTTNLLY